ncbi:hypothetical protein SE1_02764 [Enterococcus hirae EnGen0127]|uniref:hypothetical protein n=1 Tax=Enterococcus hirae TaxID=1354 RepID=UPI00032F333A|nr:hypothetical protein [Enterococcus hirae]EOF55208.1 hypothetical protein SE1_02764 [Enterococcus hirae EnGen0127]
MSQKQRPKKWLRIVMYLLFLTGGLIASYPFYVNAFNQLVDHYRINESQKTKAEQQQARERAKKYNQELAERGMGAITLPTYTGRKEADLANYLANHLIGSIQIPKIRVSVRCLTMQAQRSSNMVLEFWKERPILLAAKIIIV